MAVRFLTSTLLAAAALTVGSGLIGPAGAAEPEAKPGIEETLAAYNAALNGGNTAAVLPLYTADGVFMPPYSRVRHRQGGGCARPMTPSSKSSSST